MFSPKSAFLLNNVINKVLHWGVLLTIAGCAPGEVPAQGGFEGTLVFSMKTEITDPAMRQQTEQNLREAKAALTGPEMEKNIREAEAQLQSPEFKKQMEKNPELKKMVENQIAQLKKLRDEALANPTSNPYDRANVMRTIMKVKDGNVLTSVGGMALEIMDAKIVTLCRKADNKCYQLDHERKIYSELGAEAGQDSENEWSFKVTPVAGDSSIQGYACRKYLIEMVNKAEKQTMRGHVWATTAIQLPANNAAMQGNPTAKAFSTIQGTPLHMEMEMGDKARMVYSLESVKKEKLDTAQFALPAGYTKKGR